MEGATPKKSQSFDLAFSSRREIRSYNGVVHASSGTKEDDHQSNGTLCILQQGDKVIIEWRPNEVAVDTECQEEEWALVNTKSRTRTSSGSVEGSSSKLQSVCIPLQELKSLKVSARKNNVTLIHKNNVQKIFFFHFEKVNNFLDELHSVVSLKRSSKDSSTYMIQEKGVAQSFSDISLVDKEDSLWKLVGDLKSSPYETTLSTFSKLTELLLYRPPEVQGGRTEGEMVHLFNNSLSTMESGPEVDATYHFVCPVSGPRELQPRGEPLKEECWLANIDEDGKIIHPNKIKDTIFKGGIAPSIRPDVWKYLLGFYPWESTRKERIEILKEKTVEYYKMKAQWKTISADQESRFSFYRDKKSLVEKDVNRTDRTLPFYAGENNPNLEMLSDILMTYIMFNFDLGYVQGMSDLLSPILAVVHNEVASFWCFVGFMNIMCHNFDEDQSGMKKQLSQLHTLLTAVAPDLSTYLDCHDAGSMCFCFRWLLVWFKREFPLEDVMTLWEVLWTGLPCPNLHLLISVSILEKEKETLMSQGFALTEILKHVNDLCYKLDLDDILMRAVAIYNQLETSSNLTASTQRVLGLSHACSSVEKINHEAEDDTADQIQDIISQELNIENGYEKSIEYNYF